MVTQVVKYQTRDGFLFDTAEEAELAENIEDIADDTGVDPRVISTIIGNACTSPDNMRKFQRAIDLQISINNSRG